jgi:hypothetical protein
MTACRRAFSAIQAEAKAAHAALTVSNQSVETGFAMSSAPPVNLSTSPEPTPALDQIQFREFKILLRAERFGDPQSFHDFWKIVKQTARTLDIDAVKTDKSHEHRIREVVFFDTPDYRMYNNHFILRARCFYRNGWLAKDHRLALKFRHPDREVATATNVHPAIPAPSRIRFKEELLAERGKIGEMRAIYSHGCVLESLRDVLKERVSDIATVFPVLQSIGIQPKAQLQVVNNIFIEEVFEEIGQIGFGDKISAGATVAIWRNRHTEVPLVGEFAYQIQFNSLDRLPKRSRELSEALFKLVQIEATDWIHTGNTKTALVYKLGNQPVHNDE